MPNQKISELPAASALTGAELVEVVQTGTNKKTTAQDIADLGAGGGGASNWGDLGGTLSDQTDLQAALDLKSDSIATPVTGGTNYTLQASDLALVNAGANIIINGSGGTLTIPANATVAFPLNCFIGFRGFILVAAAGGVTATPTNTTLDCDPDFLFSLEKTATITWNVHNGSAGGGGGGGGTWGSITGTLSSQTDLQSALDAKANNSYTVSTKTANYTLSASDLTIVQAGGKIKFIMDTTSPFDFNIPTHATVAFPAGVTFHIIQYNTSQVTVVPLSGVTMRSALNANKTYTQYSEVFLTKIANNEWVLSGDITI